MAETSSIDTDELLSGIEPFTSSLASSPQRSRESSPLKAGYLDKDGLSPVLDSARRHSWSRNSDPIVTGSGRRSSYGLDREATSQTNSGVDNTEISNSSYGVTSTVSDPISQRYRHQSPPKEYTRTQTTLKYQYTKSLPATPFNSDLATSITERLMASLQESKDLEDARKSKSLTNLNKVEQEEREESTKEKSPVSRQLFSQTHGVYLTSGVHVDYARSDTDSKLDKSTDSISPGKRITTYTDKYPDVSQISPAKDSKSPDRKTIHTDEISPTKDTKSPERKIIRTAYTDKYPDLSEISPAKDPVSPEKKTLMHRQNDDIRKGSESDVSSEKTGSTVRVVQTRKSPVKSEAKKYPSNSDADSRAVKPSDSGYRQFKPTTWTEMYASGKARSVVQGSRYGLSGSMPSLSNMGSILSTLKSDMAKSDMLPIDSNKEYTDVKSCDINDMERVRGHLHDMLSLGKQMPDRDNFDHANDSVTELLHTSGVTPNNIVNTSLDDSRQKEDSFDSIKTDTLLTAKAFNDVSPMHTMGYDSGVGFSSQLWNPTSVSVSAKVTDSTLFTENQLLRDSVEREKYRRKHCERQIQQLQSKLLETQQQLAVAVSTDRKKDVMIEQLDKTLAKVVDGWKKHEAEKNTYIERLSEEKEKTEAANVRQQEMLGKFESELAQAVEQLTKEQLRASQAETDRKSQMEQQSKERNETLKILETERIRVERIDEEREIAVKRNQKLEREVDKLQRTLDEERERWHKVQCDLQEKLERAAEEHFSAMEKGRINLERECRAAEDSQKVLASVQTELEKVRMEYDTAKRDKENLKMEISLLEARNEAAKAKMESEHQSEMERQIADKLAEVHDKMAASESEIRESHRKQIHELDERHQEEMEQQRIDTQLELARKDTKLKVTTQEYEDRLEDARREIAEFQKLKQKMEAHKSELVSKLQTLMQSHCNEALKILCSSNASPANAKKPTSMGGLNTSVLSSGLLSDISRLTDMGIFEPTDHYTTNEHKLRDQFPTNDQRGNDRFQTNGHNEFDDYHYQDSIKSNQQHHSLSTIPEEKSAHTDALHVTQRPMYAQTYQEPLKPNFQPDSSQLSNTSYQQSYQSSNPPQYPDRYQASRSVDGSQSQPSYQDHYRAGRSMDGSQSQPSYQDRYQANRSVDGSQSHQPRYVVPQDNVAVKEHTKLDLHTSQSQDVNSSFYPLERHDDTIQTVDGWMLRENGDLHLQSFEHQTVRTGDRRDQDAKSNYSIISTGPLDSTHEQYDNMSDKFQRHEDKQNELQYYIKMLLDRSPGSPLSIDNQSEGGISEEPDLMSARTMASDVSTVSCPIKRAVRDNVTLGHSPSKQLPSAYPGQPASEKVMQHSKASVLPTRDTNTTLQHNRVENTDKPKYEPIHNQVPFQSPTKDIRSTMESGVQAQGVLTPMQVAEISRLLEVYKRQENTAPTSNPASIDQNSELPKAAEFLHYLREVPQLKNQQQQKGDPKQQTGVPKARRNISNQMGQKGKPQQQIGKQTQVIKQQTLRPQGSVQPIRPQQGSVQPLRPQQPSVQPCPHGRGPVTKSNQPQKDKKVSGQGVRKVVRPVSAWK